MTTLFFIFGVFVIMHEIRIIFNPGKEYELYRKFKDDKGFLTDDNTPKDEKTGGCIYAFFNIFYLGWVIIGSLMASQYLSFLWILAIGIFSFLTNKLYEKLNINGGKLHMFNKRVDALACALIALEIVFVHFHEFSIFNYLFGLIG